jgi:nucleotide-binding universal stress UspA family protein
MRTAHRTFPLSFKTIVVGLDFSRYADGAFQRAVELAQSFHSKIILTHVIDTVAYSVALNGAPFVPWQIERYVRERFDSLAEVLSRQQIDFELVIRQGPLREALCSVARDHNADLLVISSHGENRFDRDAYGSVAEKILRVAPCPVMVVGPLVAPRAPRNADKTRVLFPTGFSNTSLRTLPFADILAHKLGAELHLVHVVPQIVNGTVTARKCLDKLNEVATEYVRKTRITHCMVQVGELTSTLVSLADSLNVTATVIGAEQENLQRQPRGGLRQGLIYTIASRTSCPVITIHSGLDIQSLRPIDSLHAVSA